MDVYSATRFLCVAFLFDFVVTIVLAMELAGVKRSAVLGLNNKYPLSFLVLQRVECSQILRQLHGSALLKSSCCRMP